MSPRQFPSNLREKPKASSIPRRNIELMLLSHRRQYLVFHTMPP
jgi:hypothetical protein